MLNTDQTRPRQPLLSSYVALAVVLATEVMTPARAQVPLIDVPGPATSSRLCVRPVMARTCKGARAQRSSVELPARP